MSKRQKPLKLDDEAEEDQPAEEETPQDETPKKRMTRKQRKRAKKLELEKEKTLFSEYIWPIVISTFIFFGLTSGLLIASVIPSFYFIFNYFLQVIHR